MVITGQINENQYSKVVQSGKTWILLAKVTNCVNNEITRFWAMEKVERKLQADTVDTVGGDRGPLSHVVSWLFPVPLSTICSVLFRGLLDFFAPLP